MEKKAEKQAFPLPPGWRQLESERGIYFWHKETNRVQWKFPKEEALSYLKLKESHSYVNVGRGNTQTLDDMYAVVNTTSSHVIEDNATSYVIEDNENEKTDDKENDASQLDNGYPTPVITIPSRATENSREEISCSPPPPLPSRNYDEEDYMDGTPPPPLPERTDLSQQLISPSKMQQFLYSSNASDLHRITVDIKDKGGGAEGVVSISHDEVVYDEPIIKPKNVSKVPEEVTDGALYDEIPPSSGQGLANRVEFMIAANPSSNENIRTASLRSPDVEKVMQLTDDSVMYDEVKSSSFEPIAKNNQSLLVESQLPPPPPPRYSSASPSPTHPSRPISPSRSLPPRPPPPSSSPPPSIDITLPPPPPPCPLPIGPYHVTTPGDPSPVSDDGLMTVSHTRTTSRSPHTLLVIRKQQSAGTPQLPPRKASSVRLRRKHSPDMLKLKKADTFDALENKEGESVNKGVSEYDHLIRDKRHGSTTLPRCLDDPTYSKLNSDRSLLMRAGITIKGSLMSDSNPSLVDLDSPLPLVHAPDAPSPVIKPRPHNYEDLDETSLANDVELIHAPNAPNSNLKSRSHTYEDPDNDNGIELVHAPNVSSPKLKPRPHNYEDPDDVKDDDPSSSPNLKLHPHGDTGANNIQPHNLIHAPNPPLSVIKPRPHLYEAVTHHEAEDLAWDNSDLQPSLLATSGFDSEKDKARKVKKRKTSATPIEKPASVSEGDFERRLERLDNHFYPEIDIPLWPGTDRDTATPLPPRRASEIKQVVRNSWNVAAGANGLPPGWKREVNEQGQVFYWHLPTGNIQYTKPEGPNSSKSASPVDSESSSVSPRVLKPTTFAAEYLGSMEVPEEKLVKGKSVQVVFSAIDVLADEDISPSPGILQQVALFKRNDRVHLQVHGMELKWLNVTDGSVVVIQAINRIRVWGVGQVNNRNFGYVSRNLKTHRHQCHVFRCDIAAVGLIQSLLDSHEANKKSIPCHDGLSAQDIGNNKEEGSVLVSVPVNAAQRVRSVTQLIHSDSEKKNSEKYKRLEAVYLGSRFVTSPHGIRVVNESVQYLSRDKSKWIPVFVDVASSHIRILDKKSEMVLKEHRIRFLSFLGIAQDDQYCGYVVDNGDNQFQFHGFFCDPNSDKLCLALHSACQSRYQRVIDAHMTDEDTAQDSNGRLHKKSLLKRIGSWKSTKSPTEQEETAQPTSRNFIVQFLGMETVTKPKGIDVVTEPLQKATKKTSGIHLVELVVSGAGFTINDPQKKHFASKHIAAKKITYCVRIRSHFVYIAKEGSKHMLYMFSESEVDASILVNAVQDFMSQ